jgi:hypothetical protein
VVTPRVTKHWVAVDKNEHTCGENAQLTIIP